MKKILILIVIIYLVLEISSSVYFLTKRYKIIEKTELPRIEIEKQETIIKVEPQDVVTPVSEQSKEYKQEIDKLSNASVDELLKKAGGLVSKEKRLSVYQKRKSELDVLSESEKQSSEKYRRQNEIATDARIAEPLKREHAAFKELDDMVLVEKGEFIFGSNTGLENEKPARRVFLKSFYIDKYEVTNRKYKKFVDATGHNPPMDWSDNKPPVGKLDHPVTNISYGDAAAYAKWAGKRLPTEQEWEKASKGPGNRLYPWGDQFDENRANVLRGLGRRETTSVGSFPDGKSFYNIYDLAGNVWEWTLTDYGNSKIVRGGSFAKSAFCARTTTKEIMNPTKFATDVGFRCVKDAK